MVLFSKNALTKTWLLQSQRSVLAGTKTASTRNFTYFIKPIEKPFRKGAPIEEQKAANLWRNLLFFVGLPVVILVNANILFLEDHHPKRPEFKPYSYMRKREKKFPWGDGDHSLFHNPYYNALPDGYETPEHDEESHE